MRVHVVGNGGREDALRYTLRRTADVVDSPDDADLVVIGPEQPLRDGLADELRAQGRIVYGPSADGARLEGSKAWMKELLTSAGVPTAAYGAFPAGATTAATVFLESLPGDGYVVKTDYLAAGKGVLVTDDLTTAVDDAREKLQHGGVVIEERMTGRELSLLCVCDGERAVPLAPARDYKRIGSGDVGPMTGGMGAYSPVPGIDGDAIAKSIVQPTLDALRQRGIDYRGTLYAGLMLTPDGPKVVEFNVRFGDPEAQVVVPRFSGDFAGFLYEAATGELRTAPSFADDAWVTVVLATGGYPDGPLRTGELIEGIDAAEALGNVVVFRAGVTESAEGVRATGGRALDVTAWGTTIEAARKRAYEGVACISWPGMQYREDVTE